MPDGTVDLIKRYSSVRLIEISASEFGQAIVDKSKKLVVQYEDFCKNPRNVFDQLVEKQGIAESDNAYCRPGQFRLTRNADLPNRAVD